MAENSAFISKPRFEILDGLRGVAALIVVGFHMMETYRGPDYASQIINHGYLAVDFFFVLSGFVTGYAYDDRWGRMTTWEFFKRRLTRLHPMVVFSVIIGASFYFFQGYYSKAALQDTGWILFLACIATDLLMIPTGRGIDTRGWGEITSLNGPSWSLMFEYWGNILYALIFRRLPVYGLAAICIVSAFFTMDVALGWDVFGLFNRQQFNLTGGWILNGQHMYTGIVRLIYPYVCGLLMARLLAKRITPENPSGSPIRMKNAFGWLSLAIVVILCMPCVSGKVGVIDGLYQCLAVWLLFPLIVLVGAGSVIKGERVAGICKFLGDISYPLYIVHYPVAMMQFRWIRNYPDAPLWMHIGVFISVYVISIALAYGALKTFDEPVRAWLKKHWLK